MLWGDISGFKSVQEQGMYLFLTVFKNDDLIQHNSDIWYELV